ncbi:MAG: OmpA family protein [Planctomycetes bacterium]|nr:OmpA family protein [Planctomycetota bacterium]
MRTIRIPSLATLLLTSLVVFPSCVSNERYEAASTEVGNLDDALRKSKQQNESLRSENERLTNELELVRLDLERARNSGASEAEVAALRSQLDSLRSKFSNIDDGIKVRQVKGGTALSVEGRLLFEQGKDEITPRGAELLQKIADRIRTTNYMIRVEGHTDNQPVRATAAKYPMGNLQLAGSRSLKVAHFLIEKGGLTRERVSYAGYGAEKPVADNGTDEGRSQNRRVEIVVLDG